MDTSNKVEGVDPDLRVRPFFADGRRFSLRELTVAALRDAMGLEAQDPDLALTAISTSVVTPAGLVLNGRSDRTQAPTADADEVPASPVSLSSIPSITLRQPPTSRRR